MKSRLHAGGVPSLIFQAGTKCQRAVSPLFSWHSRRGRGGGRSAGPAGKPRFGRNLLGKKPTVRLGLGEKMGKRFPNAGFETPFPPESAGKTAIWRHLFFSCVTGDYPLAITGLAPPCPPQRAGAGAQKRKNFSQSVRIPPGFRLESGRNRDSAPEGVRRKFPASVSAPSGRRFRRGQPHPTTLSGTQWSVPGPPCKQLQNGR